MPPEHADEAALWLRKSAEDLRMAQAVLDLDPSIPAGAAFHAQQAAEKSIKGFLVSRGVTLSGRPG